MQEQGTASDRDGHLFSLHRAAPPTLTAAHILAAFAAFFANAEMECIALPYYSSKGFLFGVGRPPTIIGDGSAQRRGPHATTTVL